MSERNEASNLSGGQALVPLSEANGYKIAEGNEDVRRWEVRAQDGSKIGKVDDLLIDPDAGKVRYLDVAVDKGLFGKDRHVLIPIGTARLADDEDVVLVDVAADSLQTYPEYTGERVTRDYETSLRSHLTSASSTARTSVSDDRFDDEYGLYRGGQRELDTDQEARVTRSEEELAIGKRRVRAGEAYLRKTVETEHVREEVPVMHEEVTVERRPLSADAATDISITEDEIRVPLMQEEVIAEKRVVPKEEVVIRKRAVSDTEVVEDEVRRERIDVDEGSIRERTSRSRTRGELGPDAR
jgi:uncharacterized protein (TIGR02271 family)